MKRSKSCGCSHDAHERNGNMPRKVKKPLSKSTGGKVAISKGSPVQVGGGGKVAR